MAFAGMNHVAVIVAAVAAWLVGAAYYGTLAKPWLAALGKGMEEVKERQQSQGAVAYIPYAIAFAAELVMAWVLAGVLGHLGTGQVTLRNGILSALFVWFGVVLPVVGVNNMFGMRKAMLTVIDAGHWLAVLVVMGAIIGGWGVR